MKVPNDTVNRRLRQALKGKRTAIVRLVKTDPQAFGTRQPMAAISAAKQVLFRAAARRSLSTEEQVELDEAKQFLSKLAAALTYVPPDLRTRAMLTFCENQIQHISAAHRIIMSLPRGQRNRPSTVPSLTKLTNLDRSVVVKFLDKPRTGVLGVARDLTGKKFGVTAEHVRKLQEQHAEWDVQADDIVVMGCRPRVRDRR